MSRGVAKMRIESWRNMWASHMILKVDDAMGLYHAPIFGKIAPSLEEQHRKHRERLSKGEHNIYQRNHLFQVRENYLNCEKGRDFLERSHFDEIIDLMGYDSLFLNKIFDYVQKSISLEKELFDEFAKKDRRKLKYRRSDKERRSKHNNKIKYKNFKNCRRKVAVRRCMRRRLRS